MQDSLLLAKYVLPEEIFRYFESVKIDRQGRELHLYPEGLNEHPHGYTRSDLASKGFHTEVILKDFPNCEKPSFLHVRRRRRVRKGDGKDNKQGLEVSSRWYALHTGFCVFFKRTYRILTR